MQLLTDQTMMMQKKSRGRFSTINESKKVQASGMISITSDTVCNYSSEERNNGNILLILFEVLAVNLKYTGSRHQVPVKF